MSAVAAVFEPLVEQHIAQPALAQCGAEPVADTLQTRVPDPAAAVTRLGETRIVIDAHLEIRIGESSGMMNIGIPSIIIKMLRQKFDQQWSVRKTQATEGEHARVLRLVKPAIMQLDVRLQGPTVSVNDLMRLETGDVLTFDHPVHRPVQLLTNGRVKYTGQVVSSGRKKAFSIGKLFNPAD